MKKIVIIFLLGLGLFISFLLIKSSDQNENKSEVEKTTVEVPISTEPTGNVVLIEDDLLKALKNPSLLREARLLPREKENAIECFEIVHIDEGSRIKDLKLQKNDCLISFTSFKPQGEVLLSEVVVLNSASAMTKVLPALAGTVRVNLHYFRDGKEAISFYFLKAK